MSDVPYKPPIDKLFKYGNPADANREWPDYLALGLGPEHIPDLIRLAASWRGPYAGIGDEGDDNEDDSILGDDEGDDDPNPAWAAPIHAWRALAQLRAADAVEPLLGMLHEAEQQEDDWAMEELPDVFGMIGPVAIPALEVFLADESRSEWARVTASASLMEIAQNHPEARPQSVAALNRQLESLEEEALDLNSFMVSHLVKLKAVEAAPAIRAAFKADVQGDYVAGDWEAVRKSLGLDPSPDDPSPIESPPPSSGGRRPPWLGPALDKGTKLAKREQHRRERKARKQNRKRR